MQKHFPACSLCCTPAANLQGGYLRFMLVGDQIGHNVTIYSARSKIANKLLGCVKIVGLMVLWATKEIYDTSLEERSDTGKKSLSQAGVANGTLLENTKLLRRPVN